MDNVNSHDLSGESAAMEFDAPDTSHSIPLEDQEALMAIDGVEGFGVSGIRQLSVFVRDREVWSKLPEKIGEFEVVVKAGGEVRSL